MAAPILSWLVTQMMVPSAPFDAAAPPAAPDYTTDAAWSLRPPAGASPTPLADVFYVHPTSYVKNGWNGPIDDPALNAATDAVATGVQAPAFTACCAIYAPRYRQANGSAFYTPTPDGDRAIDLAYHDVSDAFHAFLAQRDPARPFLLAGHSQGSALALRLLLTEIARTPLQAQLVAAYLPGVSVPLASLAAAGVPACQSPTDTGCVTSWNARSDTHTPTAFEVFHDPTAPRLCTNPLTWTTAPTAAPASASLGAVFPEFGPTPLPAFASARCDDGTLRVALSARPPRTLPSKLLDRVMGRGNYHPVEYQIFFLDIEANARARARAMGASDGG